MAMEYNGSAVIAMTGKNCVAIASDRRFGAQGQMVSTDMQRIFRMHDKLYIGMAGLATDVQTLSQLLQFRLNLYKLREERDIKPQTFAHMVSQILYGKRFGPYFVEPVVAGLDSNNQPYINVMDLIGAPVLTDDFVVAGTSSQNLYGMAEALYRKDLNPDELFETISQALLASIDRDALAGWGAIVHIITPEGVSIRELKARQD